MRASHDLFTLALIGHDLTKLTQLLRIVGGMGQSGGHADQDAKVSKLQVTSYKFKTVENSTTSNL